MIPIGRKAACIAFALVGAACRSVEVPQDRFYGLVSGPVEPGRPLVDVVRVMELRPMGASDRDHLLVTDGVRWGTRPFERWLQPVDRLLGEALVLGLTRHRVARLVAGSTDLASPGWTLQGRVIDFAEHRLDEGAEARVELELWLAEGETLLLRDVFAAREPIEGEGPEAFVLAMSRAVDRLIADFVGRVRAADLPVHGS